MSVFFGVDPSGQEADFFDSLLSEKTSYKKVAGFRFDLPWWLDPQIPLVNPEILIFARQD